jgi:hypothetical protein
LWCRSARLMSLLVAWKNSLAMDYWVLCYSLGFSGSAKTHLSIQPVVPCCCDTSIDSPLSWPPPSPVLLPSTVTPCCGTAHATTVLSRPPAAAPAGGCVACRVPAPDLPASSPMPRGPPQRALFPEYMVPDGNRLGADSCAPVGPTAASGPGFHVRWPPSGPMVSARAIPVSAGWLGPPADARFPPLSMNFWSPLHFHVFAGSGRAPIPGNISGRS